MGDGSRGGGPAVFGVLRAGGGRAVVLFYCIIGGNPVYLEKKEIP